MTFTKPLPVSENSSERCVGGKHGDKIDLMPTSLIGYFTATLWLLGLSKLPKLKADEL